MERRGSGTGDEQEVGIGEPGTKVRRGEGGSQPTRGSLHEYVKNSSAASSSSMRAQLAAADPIEESESHEGMVAAM